MMGWFLLQRPLPGRLSGHFRMTLRFNLNGDGPSCQAHSGPSRRRLRFFEMPLRLFSPRVILPPRGQVRAAAEQEGRMGTGFRILPRQRAASAEWVERFRPLPVANVSDVMARITAGGPRLRPMHRGGGMVGPALTVKTRPGDNLLIHKALSLAAPGDVIVVDGGGDLTNALIGELMVAQMVKRRVGGIVLNGAIRDCATLREQDFPVYAAGVTHRGPYKDGPGEINVPIAIDGMVIAPGDLILGDDDGLLCVPFGEMEAIHAAAAAKHAAEQKMIADIEAGTNDVSWVDAALRRLGCEGL
jgi:RraA family protein